MIEVQSHLKYPSSAQTTWVIIAIQVQLRLVSAREFLSSCSGWGFRWDHSGLRPWCKLVSFSCPAKLSTTVKRSTDHGLFFYAVCVCSVFPYSVRIWHKLRIKTWLGIRMADSNSRKKSQCSTLINFCCLTCGWASKNRESYDNMFAPSKIYK
jgi:hypothetical protein